MGSLNRESVRDEAERIKLEFNRISSSKKMDTETKILFQSMLMLVNLLIAIFLEKTTKKNSKNSSKPPSQTEKDESSLSHNGTNGKGKIESDAIVNNTRTIETVTTMHVTECDVCGADLSDSPCEHIERRTKIDIIFEKTVEHVDVETKRCDNCDSMAKGKFPSDMPGPLQYGNGLKAYIISLLICQMVALNRVQKMIKSLIGELISEATLLKYVLRLYSALENWELNTTEHLLKCKAINVDETSLRVDKKNHWIHVYSSGDITLKFWHGSKNRHFGLQMA